MIVCGGRVLNTAAGKSSGETACFHSYVKNCQRVVLRPLNTTVFGFTGEKIPFACSDRDNDYCRDDLGFLLGAFQMEIAKRLTIWLLRITRGRRR